MLFFGFILSKFVPRVREHPVYILTNLFNIYYTHCALNNVMQHSDEHQYNGQGIHKEPSQQKNEVTQILVVKSLDFILKEYCKRKLF